MPHDRESENTNEKSGKAESEHSPELLSHPSYEELMQQLGEAEQKANQYWERILRMQAENDNLIRRSERDVANAHKYALEKFAAELLPIVDSLELCVNNASDSTAESILEGVKLTLKMFYAAMEKFGVKQVNPISEPFDPEFQQAIAMQEDPGFDVDYKA